MNVASNLIRFHPAYVKMRSSLRHPQSLVGPKVNYCDVRIDTDSLVGDRYGWLCDDQMGGGDNNS